MKDISIPLNGISENQTVEIEMRVKGLEKVFLFKIESFPWEASDADKQINSESAKIYQLKKNIQDYDKEWELMQIFTPSENATHIQILYRKRTSE